MSVPERITIELSSRCHKRCPSCPRKWMKDDVGDIDRSRFMDLCDEAQRLQIPTMIAFWRGESVLHPEFPQLIRYAAKRFMTVELATGTVTWTIDMLRIVPLLSFLSISMHDNEGIGLLHQVLDAREPGKPFVQLTAVKGEPTEKTVKMLARFVDRVRIYEPHTLDGVWGQNGEKCGGKKCPKLATDMVVGWNGRVSRCSHVYDTEDLNVFEDGIVGVWDSPTWKVRRESELDEICRACSQRGPTKGETIYG